MGKARCWNLYIPLLHAKVVLLEQQGVLLDVFVLMVRVFTVGVVGQDQLHKLFNTLVDQF